MLGYYLMFNRNCAEALEVYAKALDAKIKEKQTYGEIMKKNPAFPLDKEDENLIIYSKLKIGSAQLICVDSSERSLAGFNTYIFIKDEEDFVKKAWSVLVQDGVIYADLQPNVFAALHGSLRDKFGINWMFTVPKPEAAAKTPSKKMKSLPPRVKSSKPLPKIGSKEKPEENSEGEDSLKGLENKPPKAILWKSGTPPINWE